MTKEQQREIMENTATALAEHFDTVHIFVCVINDDNKSSRTLFTGRGNWFTRYGQISEWVTREKERMRVEIRREVDEDDAK